MQHDALVLPAADVLQRLMEVLLAALHRGRLLLVAGHIGVDQLDETVHVLGRHLSDMLAPLPSSEKMRATHRFVLLIKVVHVAIENLHKQLDRRSRLHASVSDTEGTLQAFQHALAVAV